MIPDVGNHLCLLVMIVMELCVVDSAPLTWWPLHKFIIIFIHFCTNLCFTPLDLLALAAGDIRAKHQNKWSIPIPLRYITSWERFRSVFFIVLLLLHLLKEVRTSWWNARRQSVVVLSCTGWSGLLLDRDHIMCIAMTCTSNECKGPFQCRYIQHICCCSTMTARFFL